MEHAVQTTGATSESGHIPTSLDVGFDPTEITKEWLEHIILGAIRPRLDGVVINPINLASHAPGKVAYVVYVPQSRTAHQASDKKYYKRFNFEASAMEDYEIRDIMNRLKHPVLVPQFTRKHLSASGTVTQYILDITLKNEGAVRANDIKVVITIPQKISHTVHGVRQYPIKRSPGIFGDTWLENSFSSRQHVIFPSDKWNVNEASVSFVITIDSQIDRDEAREPFLHWETFANDMPAMHGSVFLKDVPIV